MKEAKHQASLATAPGGRKGQLCDYGMCSNGDGDVIEPTSCFVTQHFTTKVGILMKVPAFCQDTTLSKYGNVSRMHT